jgi:hypothetical protein
VNPEALNLALLLVERGLVDLAPRSGSEYEKLYNDYRGQAVAQVTTAIPLDEELRAGISRELQEITGKKILLQERVDPSILGGAIARVGDTLIDGSLKRRFEVLREQIVAGGNFGGPNDGAPALLGPGGGISPTGGDAPQPDGPSSSTDAAPRASDGPHLAPRNDIHTSPADNTRTGPARSGGRNKRRRR